MPAGIVGERELWRRHRDGRDRAAREELVRRYLPYARKLTLRYLGGREPNEDLLQVANLALVKAVDRFDFERGIPFAGFAAPTILGELKRHFRDRVWTVRVPRGIHDRLAEVDKAVTKLTVELQRAPSVSEIATYLEIDAAEVLEALEAAVNRRPFSLDRPLEHDDEDVSPALERIGDEDRGFELVDDRLAIAGALDALDDRDREALRLRFVDDLTQSQIAARMGCSQMHVSRILRRALAVLREEASSAAAEGDEAQPSIHGF